MNACSRDSGVGSRGTRTGSLLPEEDAKHVEVKTQHPPACDPWLSQVRVHLTWAWQLLGLFPEHSYKTASTLPHVPGIWFPGQVSAFPCWGSFRFWPKFFSCQGPARSIPWPPARENGFMEFGPPHLSLIVSHRLPPAASESSLEGGPLMLTWTHQGSMSFPVGQEP